jgi:hypothetical protein
MSEEMYHPPVRQPTAAPATPAKTARRRNPLKGLAVLAAGSFLALAASHAVAANTRIQSSIGNDEPSHQQILENLYGGSFARAGDDFSNGQVDVQRVSDGAGAEAIFGSDFVSARAVASFARNSQTLGALDAEGGFVPLLRTQRNALDAAGPVDLRGSGLSNTILALQSGGSTFAADASLNPGGADHLVSYAVKGHNSSASPDAFLLFWEDTASNSSDHDYNDLVVEVSAAGGVGGGPANVLIPVPPAAWSGLIVMAGVSVAAGIKRLRRR